MDDITNTPPRQKRYVIIQREAYCVFSHMGWRYQTIGYDDYILDNNTYIIELETTSLSRNGRVDRGATFVPDNVFSYSRNWPALISLISTYNSHSLYFI